MSRSKTLDRDAPTNRLLDGPHSTDIRSYWANVLARPMDEAEIAELYAGRIYTDVQTPRLNVRPSRRQAA